MHRRRRRGRGTYIHSPGELWVKICERRSKMILILPALDSPARAPGQILRTAIQVDPLSSSPYFSCQSSGSNFTNGIPRRQSKTVHFLPALGSPARALGQIFERRRRSLCTRSLKCLLPPRTTLGSKTLFGHFRGWGLPIAISPGGSSLPTIKS